MWNFNKKKKKDVKPNIIWLDETDSTNNYLKNYIPASDEKISVVVADYQKAGRGQGTNTWESEPGENLLFSILVHPVMVPVHCQFLLSMAEALALKEVLDNYTEGITLKWPNDIYWNDKKIGGTLIETTLGGGHIKNCIFGTGIDVNQTEFKSSAPNPVSLKNIIGNDVDRKKLMDEIVTAFIKYYAMIENGQYGDISALYHLALYRRHGFFNYRDVSTGEVFEAAIVEVGDDGTLVVRDRKGVISEYRFKEIETVL